MSKKPSGKIGIIAKNDYIFSVVIKCLLVLTGALHSVFLARFLGAELKGTAATITSTVAITQILVTVGIHQAYPYFRKEGTIENFLEKFINNVYAVFFFWLILCASICLALYSVLPFKVLCIIMLTPVFGYETITGYVFLIEKPKTKNVWMLIASLSETLLILLLWIFAAPNNFLMLLAITLCILVRLTASTINLKVKPQPSLISFKFIFKMLRFGFLPMLALLFTILNSKVDILMMNFNGTITDAQIGIYSVGIGFADKILMVPDAVREILLSKLVKTTKEKEEVAKVTRICFVLCLLIAGLVLAFGRIVIDLLYGDEYTGAYWVMSIAACGTAFMVFLKMISQYNIVNNKQLTNLLLLSISVVTNIILNLIFIPIWGINGAALASFAGHFVCAVCFIIYFSHKTKTKVIDLLIPKKSDFAFLKGIKK